MTTRSASLASTSAFAAPIEESCAQAENNAPHTRTADAAAAATRPLNCFITILQKNLTVSKRKIRFPKKKAYGKKQDHILPRAPLLRPEKRSVFRCGQVSWLSSSAHCAFRSCRASHAANPAAIPTTSRSVCFGVSFPLSQWIRRAPNSSGGCGGMTSLPY